jgi:hypothetical protein
LLAPKTVRGSMTGAAAAAAIKVRRFMDLSFIFGSIGRTPCVTLNRAWKAETGWKRFVFFIDLATEPTVRV